MGRELRFLAEDADIDRAMDVFWTALAGFTPPPIEHPVTHYTEAGRTLAVYEDGRPVGTAASYTSGLVVPGGARVPHAAVTDVGVLPTHTRQGVARELMAAQLADVAARGEIVATLRASEAGIYERFGYGVAGRAHGGTLKAPRVRWRKGVPQSGRVRLVPFAEALPVLQEVYGRAATWAGAIDRPVYWWRTLELFAKKDGGRGFVVLHGEPGAEDGFVRYHADDAAWERDDHLMVVDDLVAVTPAAQAGLLRYLASIDRVTALGISALPADHATGELLVDERAWSTTSVWDEIWLRPVDVGAALAARTYAAGEPVVIDVADAVLPSNAGSYAVSPDGAARTDAAPDLEVDVATLGAAYLGGTPFWQLALGGRVTELTPGAVSRADALFRTERAPFAGTFF